MSKHGILISVLNQAIQDQASQLTIDRTREKNRIYLTKKTIDSPLLPMSEYHEDRLIDSIKECIEYNDKNRVGAFSINNKSSYYRANVEIGGERGKEYISVCLLEDKKRDLQSKILNV
ncbi:MAG: hypothetical protein Q7S27_07165 [Nanoarchaeota archaeon]|nr:hypothetical protein [Nanoarchaeota archaeon]